MAMQEHFLTKEWYEKLVEELRMLKEEKLPATLERLKEAIAQWDISENAEYDTSMSEKDLIWSRINEIEEMLLNVQIIEKNAPGGDVRYGSVVTFKDDKDREYTVTVVGSGEMDILSGTISLDSPLGIALRWKSKGMVAPVKAPNRKYMIEIMAVN